MKFQTYSIDPCAVVTVKVETFAVIMLLLLLTKCFIPERAGSAFKTSIPVWLFITNCLLNHKLFRRAKGGVVIICIRQHEYMPLKSNCGSNPGCAFINWVTFGNLNSPCLSFPFYKGDGNNYLARLYKDSLWRRAHRYSKYKIYHLKQKDTTKA